ncbi:COR domain-containing protein [Streptomyces puniciscabiei]|uniref:COR domain-containing protein n=1 Tax=Streptomyces puniciscabiei TaxID=164348 RepID=UPI003323E452
MPETIGELHWLLSLTLSSEQLVGLPRSIAKLTNLKALTIIGNGLATFPEALGRFTTLTDLRISAAELTELPDDLFSLTNLRSLTLYTSNISVLPEGLGNLTELVELTALLGGMTAIPDSIGRLTHLTQLQIQASGITTLPDSFGNLTELKTLKLEIPELTVPPPEVVAGGASAVVAYMQGARDDAVRQWASKLLVVGQGRSGKTSLLKALRGEAHDPNEDSTHGLHVGRLRLPHPDPPKDDEADELIMELSTWDFGGQDIYHATHQFFLSDRSLFLLLWDAQVGWEESKLYYWLDLIKARAPHAPVIIVATHLGPRPPDLPLHTICDAFPGLVVESMAADSATGEGVDAVRERIAAEAARLPLMGAIWPRHWLEAAEAVRAHPEKHVEPRVLWDLMAEHGVIESAQQHYLASALHSLGDILFYPEDDELSGLVILHPQWLTSYISRVLDAKEVREAHGIFTSAHRDRLWPDLDRSMQNYFVSMMERFDLSYRTTDASSSLVVELLPWDPPDYQERWDSALEPHRRELRLRYRLHTVPPGIPTWFIAREHRFTIDVNWRTGALLRHQDGRHYGLVTVDRYTKTAEIQARGPYPHHFFSILMDGFEQTLVRYPGLEITRYVPCPGVLENDESCHHEFPHTNLLDRLSRTPPLETIECPVHYEQLNVRKLLHGIEPPAQSRSEELAVALEAKVDGLSNDLKGIKNQSRDILDEVKEARIQQTAVAAEQQRAFLTELRRADSRQAVLCPSVVSVQRVRRRRLKGIWRDSVFQLHLYCEAPGAWHRIPGVKPYEVRASSDLEQTVLPYARRVLAVLKYAVPVAGAALGVAADDLDKLLKSDVALMKELVKGLPDELISTSPQLGDIRSLVRVTEHHEYRQMQSLLLKLDPAGDWGGLNKVTTPEGPTYWLCDAHTREYRRHPGNPPAIPPP